METMPIYGVVHGVETIIIQNVCSLLPICFPHLIDLTTRHMHVPPLPLAHPLIFYSATSVAKTIHRSVRALLPLLSFNLIIANVLQSDRNPLTRWLIVYGSRPGHPDLTRCAN
jgi:hypothetical protein